MLKQSDAIILFVVLAAVITVLIMSSNTASLVVIGVLTLIFGALVGAKLRNRMTSEAAEADPEHANEEDVQEQDGESDIQQQQTATAADQSSAQHAAATGGEAHGGSTVVTATRAPASATPTTDSGAQTQVQLLKNLVSSVSEGITFKDPQGRYLSANAAFAQMLDSQPSEIVGQDDAGVFGHLTAKSLLASDDAAAQQGRISTTLEVPLPSGPRYFEITKSSVSADDDSLEGIVAVWRDVTDVAISSIRRDKAMRETIMAFTKAIELRDTFLGDHAQRLAQLSSAVADEMALDDDVATTVELAAYLSQIGKLGIDATLLSEQRRFTEIEIKEMQKHVHHTARILRDMDFGLPVAATLFQIHERLDGSGYPQGLSGGDIALPARILGTCDVFCARTAARSYRPAIEPQAALEILQQNPHRYDEEVVSALVRVVLNDDE